MRIKKVAEAKHEATKTPATNEFLEKALGGSLLDLLNALRAYPQPWNEPRGDLYHWIPLLNVFDLILSDFNSTYDLVSGPQTRDFTDQLLRKGIEDADLHIKLEGIGNGGTLGDSDNDESFICTVLDFGRLLLDNCANRTLYNSSEHVEHLLNSTSSAVVASALHLGSRYAATYYRSNSHRTTTRQAFNAFLLQTHYRINTDSVQKLAEPFSACVVRTTDLTPSQPQTPTAKLRDPQTPSKARPRRQAPEIQPGDLQTFVGASTDAGISFGDYGGVDLELGTVTNTQVSKPHSPATHAQVSADAASQATTPTPRRTFGPSRLNQISTMDETSDSQEGVSEQDIARHDSQPQKLVISPREIEGNSLNQLMRTYLPRLPSANLAFDLLTKVRTAKLLQHSTASRQRCVAIRILALTNVAFLYSESAFTQKILQQDSQLPRELQLVYQLAALVKPGENSAPAYLRGIALEALEAISLKHRPKHADISNALGINVNHGIIFQLLREIDQDLRSDKPLDAATLDRHERTFNLLDSLLMTVQISSRNGRLQTIDTLISAGLFNSLIEILNIRSEKAQHAQHRAIHFIHEGSRQARDGVRIFANASGLDVLSDLIAWEVETCLKAVEQGQGLPASIKSKVMDYTVPIWHQQTLRTALKFVNHLLSQQTAQVERLLRNLIESPQLLKAINQMLTSSKTFGSNIYANTISMVSTFLHTEPTSFSVIQEAGISRRLLDGISRPLKTDEGSVASARKLPLWRSEKSSGIKSGPRDAPVAVDMSRPEGDQLASNILCSTDVLLNLPYSFGALCVTNQGLQQFLGTNVLESYFEVFESSSHVKTIASEKDLATFIGNAFDELVRRHPDLRTAVLRCSIMTLARLADKCRAMPPAPFSEFQQPLSSSGSPTDYQGKPSNRGNSRGSGHGPAENLYEILAPTGQPDAATFVTVFCRFMNGFFVNQQMALHFLDSGGLPFVLDLCELPSLPYNFVQDPNYSSSYDLSKTIHILAESRPGQTIPLLLSKSQQALSSALNMVTQSDTRQTLQAIATAGDFNDAFAKRFTRSFTTCLVFVNALQELLSHSVFPRPHERNYAPLTSVNATEMWVDLINQLESLNSICISEALDLSNEMPEILELATRVKGNGIGSEANKILGISLHLPFVATTSTETDYNLSCTTSKSPAEQALGQSAETPAKVSGSINKSVVINTKILRHMLISMPNVISMLYLNAGNKIVSKRMRDYPRQNAFMITETIAKSIMTQLAHGQPASSAKNDLVGAYRVVLLDIIRRILNINDVDSGSPSHFMTMLFLSLRQNGLVAWLNTNLESSVRIILGSTSGEKQHDGTDSTGPAVTHARIFVHLTLILFGCVVSSKYTIESNQGSVLSTTTDLNNQFSFNPARNLVENRAAILPAIQNIWSMDGAEHLSASNLKRVIRILQTILEAENEVSKFDRRKTDTQIKQRSPHKPFTIINTRLNTMVAESQGNHDKWDHDLICEALYRCNNDLEMAKDYANARVQLEYPRFPPPSYDIDLASTKATQPTSDAAHDSSKLVHPSAETSDGNSHGTAEVDNEEDTRMRLLIDSTLTITDGDGSAAEVLPADANASASGEGDAHIRAIAMSGTPSDTVVTERERPPSQPSQTTSNFTVEGCTTIQRDELPVEITIPSSQTSTEDLETSRKPLRGRLILRVMEILSVHDNLTVDLADLLSTAARKASDEEGALRTREEFGETLIQALVSLSMSEDFREDKKYIAACANLLARLMQYKEFYEACKQVLFENGAVNELLGYIRTFDNIKVDEGHPWIGHVLLIFEKLLSEELQPMQIDWQAPKDGEDLEQSDEPIANYVKPLLQDDQRNKLFTSLVELLPHIGKDQSLALSVVRVLVMLTRHQDLASRLATKQNLQRLFLMIKQMAGLNIEAIQNAFMLILRHIIDDDETLRRTMRNTIIDSFTSYRVGDSASHDTTHYVRQHQASIIRAPKIFLEVTNEVLELTYFNSDQSPQMLKLKKGVVPQTFTAWQPRTQSAKTGEEAVPSASEEAVPASEPSQNSMTPTAEKTRQDLKTPIAERSDGLVHFLLSQLLQYRNVEDKKNERPSPDSQEKDNAKSTEDSDMDTSDTKSSEDTTTNNDQGSNPTHNTAVDRKNKEEFKTEDHPIWHYRCFLLQCLTELLMSYDQAKVEFINFSRRADPKLTTPSKPRSGVLNYLLNDLIPLDHLTRDTTVEGMKKQCISTWSMSVVVALCKCTPETYRDSRDNTAEARNNDLLFVRKFVIEHTVRTYRDIQNNKDPDSGVTYARMLSLSDLFHRILMGRVLAVHSSMSNQQGETEPRSEMHKTQIAKIMFEKNLIGVLTASCSDIDLNVSNAKRAIKYILRPLKILTFTAIEFSRESDASTTPGQGTEEDDISTATSVSDLSDEREETPDLFRHSTLGMLDTGREDDEESDESEEEDEEMYDEGYDDGMEYDDDMDQVDDDEAVSDPDEEDEEMGPIEGRNGDMVMDIQVMHSDIDDSGDDEDEDEDNEDVSVDDDDDRVTDETLEELEGDDSDDDSDDEMRDLGDLGDSVFGNVTDDDGDSLAEHETEWHNMNDEGVDERDIDALAGDDSVDPVALVNRVLDSRIPFEDSNFDVLNEDIENGRYMADMHLIHDEDEDPDDDEDEDDDDMDEDDDEGDRGLVYEPYDDDEDEEGLGWNMAEAYDVITGGASRHHNHPHHLHSHHHHAHHHWHDRPPGIRGGPFRPGDVLLTSDGRSNVITPHGTRMHRGNGPDSRNQDEGANPLLAASTDDHTTDDHWLQGSSRNLARGLPSIMHAVLGGPDRGGLMSGLMNSMPEIISRHGGWTGTGNIMINAAFPEDLDFFMGSNVGFRSMRFDISPGDLGTIRGTGSSRDEMIQPSHFVPTMTPVRWQEEAKIMFSGRTNESASHVIPSILRLLVPAAVERQREAERQREIERARQKEERAKEEARRKEEVEKQRQAQEREQREREEQAQRDQERERQEREQQAAQSTPSAAEPASTSSEAMEIDEAGRDSTGSADQSAAQPDTATRPRVTTTLRDREVDITDLGIDPEYIEALPEDLREEVVMGALQEQREQTAHSGQVPLEVNQEFLNALPPDLREHIIQQEQSDRRRRERQEARRREQEASGAPVSQGPIDMDLGSFLATLDPELRRQVILEEEIPAENLEGLPSVIRREVEEMEAAVRRQQRRQVAEPQLRDDTAGQSNERWPGYRDNAQARAVKKSRPIVQMLDKQGIATVLRLLFVPQQGSLKDSLNIIYDNLAQNRQNRAELISILLSVLQEGSSDSTAIERSYASLSVRARQKDGIQMTPKQLKRTLTDRSLGGVATMPSETTPVMVLMQCLASLVHLSQYSAHVQGFFVNEHETTSSLKRKGKGKEKEKDTKAHKFALNALLGLLDRKMIMENASCMEHLSNLLQHVTQPLMILARREREEKERKEREAEEEAKKSVQTESPQGNPAEAGNTVSGGDNTEEKGVDDTDANKTAKDKTSAKPDEKKQRTLVPPVIPESNLRLVVNIITARECNGKIFRDTMGIFNNLSAIPGAKDVFGRELVEQAQQLGDTLAADLGELLNQLHHDRNSSSMSMEILGKFSPSSSNQTKLLRVLTALDYLFDPKRISPLTAENGLQPETKSDMLSSLYDSPTFTPVWNRLSDCLHAIRGRDSMINIATILLPLVEALMVVCKNTNLKDTSAALSKSQQFTITSPEPESSMDTLFFRFTEDHRKVLNDLVRNNPRLMSGTFSHLVKNPKVLEFDNKRNYFNRKLHTRDENRRPQPSLQLNIRRDMIFLDSYKALFFKKPEEIKFGKLNIKFNGEEGVDAGGVTREWFQAISRQMFDTNYVLFVPVASDRTTFHPNKLSHVNPEHLSYFKFIGRIIGKAMYEGRPLDCHFSRAVYKRILGKSVSIKDMETLDLDYYKSLLWMLENDITDVLTETFSVENENFGVTQVVDLIPDGRKIAVTEENKHEFVQKVVEYRLTGSVQKQLEHFLSGFHDIVPANLINIFNEQELELLISGLPDIDVDDWKANTEYHNYSQSSAQIQWFWRAVRSFDKEERAKLLQFVTGTSKVPLNGFKELEGMNGVSKFNVHRDYGAKERLPSSHTCFNQLDLPEYDDYETLRSRLYTAMTAGGEYFGFA